MTITLQALSLVGKSGAGPSSLLHTMLEGTIEYVNARWMECPHGFLHDIKGIMFHGHLDCFLNRLLEVGLTQNWETVALRMLAQPVVYSIFIMCEGPCE